MTEWTLYKTAGVGAIEAAMPDIGRLMQSKFFDEFAALRPEQEPFPPRGPLANNQYVVVDVIANRWSELICIGHVRIGTSPAGAQTLAVLVPFPPLMEALQGECFLMLVMPDAAERRLTGGLMSIMEQAGFALYAMQYYHSAKPELWAEHYEPFKAMADFANVVASKANRPLSAMQFYLPGRRLADALSLAHRVMADHENSGLVHISALAADAERERDIWLDDYVE